VRASAIEIVGAGKRFAEVVALAEIHATIGSGCVTGIVGPDGAGKTTLLRMLAGLLTPSEGRVRIAGADVVEDAEQVHAVTGYMPQRFGLYEDLSVFENLRLYASLCAIDVGSPDLTFDGLLHLTGLEPFTTRLAGRLSGGMKQKLALACALLGKPSVLLLDEPSAGVDPVSRRALWRVVRKLADEGVAVVWSTAYLDEAERCDSVLLLNAGKLEYSGPPFDLTKRLAGRSFQLLGSDSDRHSVLAQALRLSAVSNGVVEGAAVRVLLRAASEAAPLQALAREHGGRVEAITPRFEDAFFDLLGGGSGARSTIAEKMAKPAFESAVSCRDLTKRFGGFTAVDGVSLDVRPGEIFGLLGPNGAGKSTMFQMLCGLLRPTSGEAYVAGHSLKRAQIHAKRALGYMAQKFSLYGLLSVRQNLEFFSAVYGLTGATRRGRIAEMVETFDLAPYLHASPSSLPLGFKQRLALACALMHRPHVLFLDEPTSGVDPITRREFWTHINGLAREGVTVLVTTHFMDEAEYCDRVAIMYRSKVLELDSPDALRARAADKHRSDLTMEDAFVTLIEAADHARAREAL
jgi:ABC-2 type transport system ATP-binding protein